MLTTPPHDFFSPLSPTLCTHPGYRRCSGVFGRVCAASRTRAAPYSLRGYGELSSYASQGADTSSLHQVAVSSVSRAKHCKKPSENDSVGYWCKKSVSPAWSAPPRRFDRCDVVPKWEGAKALKPCIRTPDCVILPGPGSRLRSKYHLSIRVGIPMSRRSPWFPTVQRCVQ